MSTINLLIYVVGALITLGTAARFIGHWFGRVVGELVTQTKVFRELSDSQRAIAKGIIRIERRQMEDRRVLQQINGSKQ
jgi:hypothetical protein